MRTGLILGAAALAVLVGAGAALAMDPPEDQKPPPEPVWPPGGKASPLPSDTPTLPSGTVAPYHQPIPRVGDTLVSTRWRAVTIRGRPVAKGHEPTLDFVDDGHLRGSTGCNRFVGPWATRVEQGRDRAARQDARRLPAGARGAGRGRDRHARAHREAVGAGEGRGAADLRQGGAAAVAIRAGAVRGGAGRQDSQS